MVYSKKTKIILLALILLVLAGVVALASIFKRNDRSESVSILTPKTPRKVEIVKLFAMPLSNTKDRITKKHLGTYVTPKNSPVSPEVFTGFHTAVDFETFSQEQNTDVLVFAICSGDISIKKIANGYGGMVVQNCTLDGSPVTVIYGHVRLSDMKADVGDIVEKGEFLTNLGTGFGLETGGERKHLHLGIHNGLGIDTRGYVANENDLNNWVNFEEWVE